MKFLLRRTALCAVLLALAAPLAAADDVRATRLSKAERATERAAAKERKARRKAIRRETTAGVRVAGSELEASLERIESLAWHDDVSTALAAAKKADKPVFLMKVLGDRCGHV